MRKYHFFIQALSVIVVTQVMGLICWNMIPRLGPLFLEQAGANAATISLLIGTLPQMITLILTPVVSIWSDNHSSAWGRRRPFLWWSAPLFCLALLGIHFASTNVLLLGCALTLFALASLVPSTLVFYLVPETIPREYIGRFTAWNGAISSICAAAYNYFGLAWSSQHSLAAIAFAIALYIVAMFFLLVIPRNDVSENKPPQSPKPFSRIWTLGRSCATECFRDPKYLMIFLCMGFNQASMILRTIFGILFATNDLAMSPKEFGHIGGICSAIGAITAILLGKHVDRHSPATFYLHGSLYVIVISIIGFFFTNSATSYMVIAIITTICYSIQSIAYTPLLVAVFPKEKYGQFSSINSTICTLMVMAGSALGGWLTQHMGFRIMFLWDFILTAMGTMFLLGFKRMHRNR